MDVRFRMCKERMGIKEREEDGVKIYRLFVHSFFIGKLLKMTSIMRYEEMMDVFFMRLFNRVAMKERMPDILYAHYLPYAAMALSAKKRYNIPVVGMEHWSQLGEKNINKNIKCWAEYTYRNLNQLLTVSSFLKSNIYKNIGVESIVVNNMVPSEFDFVERADDGIVRFISTGNLLPVKGYDVLIKAFNHANLPHKSWSLNIIGDGEEYKNLVQMIKKYHLEKNIHLKGRMDREGVVKNLQNSDVYVLSSYSETFGVSAIEALACGLPVIATECGGTKDYMTELNGLTCQTGDVVGMSNAIKYMYHHYKDFDRKRISETCHNRFSSRTIAKQLDRLFHKIVYNNL